jgi:hypothetical protein
VSLCRRCEHDKAEHGPKGCRGDASHLGRFACQCQRFIQPAPQPDLDAIRREAFDAGWYRRGAYRGAKMPPARTRENAYAAWQAQRRGETP